MNVRRSIEPICDLLVTRFVVTPLLVTALLCLVTPQQRAGLDFILQGNNFLIWYDTIIIIKVHQKLSDLFQGTHSQTFNKVKKSLRPSPLLNLKACFSRQVDVVPPQAVAAKVTVLYVTVHLNLRSVLSKRCFSAVCLRPCLRPDNRELRLIIGIGNNNITHLIIVT